MIPNEKGCQCQCENLRAASSAMPMIMVHRRLKRVDEFLHDGFRYLRNRGPLRAVGKLFSFAMGKAQKSGGLKTKAGNNSRDLKKEQLATDGAVLNLQPGELVAVKSEEEIRETFDGKNSSKGLLFLPEMKDYCGKQFRVFKRLERMMIESSGEIRRVKNTVLLEGVMCDGSKHNGCDRSCFFYWREAWLRKAG